MLVRSISMRLSDRRKKDRHESKKERSADTNSIPTPHTSHQSTSPAISNIHRVQELVLENVEIATEYDVEKTIAEGCFARILLATNKKDKTTVVLKAVHTELTNLKDFSREFHYSYHLSPHPGILASYEVNFKADDCFIFAQEYAPFGDLAANVKAGGLSEEFCKKIAQQLTSALEFVHSKQLVHRDIKLENVLVFDQDMSRVKLCDFGATRREGTLVSKLRCNWLSFVPPELCEVVSNERYNCKSSSDVWQLGVLIFVCLTGYPPWQNADCISDASYASFWRYQKRRVTKVPHQFRKFSPRLLRMFRRMFEHKPDKRAVVTEVGKYLKDSWMDSKLNTSHSDSKIMSSNTILAQDRRDSLQTYLDQGDHTGSDENKSRLKRLLSSYGLETTVDQKVLTKRVWDWVLQCENQTENASTNCSMTSLATLTTTTANLESKVC